MQTGIIAPSLVQARCRINTPLLVRNCSFFYEIMKRVGHSKTKSYLKVAFMYFGKKEGGVRGDVSCEPKSHMASASAEFFKELSL